MKIKGIVQDEKGVYYEFRQQIRKLDRPPEIPEEPITEPVTTSRPFKMGAG